MNKPKLNVVKGAKAPEVAATVDPDQARYDALKKILDDAEKKLNKYGVKYFLGVVDKNPKRSDGGKAFVASDVTGEDFTHLLDLALPTAQDAINLGIWVGQILQHRNKNLRKNGK